jgi:hypothetical protein
MGCNESKTDSDKITDHKGDEKKRDLSDMAWERLNRETKLLRAVTQNNQESNFENSRAKILEYYSASNMKCKGQKGYECNYIACQAWCKYCGYLDFSDDDLRCLDDFSNSHVKHTKKLHVQLIGPNNTPYNNKFY